MLWGQILKNNKISTITSETPRILHITNATLVKNGDSDRIFIQLSYDNLRINIGSFLVSRCESLHLDIRLQLSVDKEYKIMLLNCENSEVHLSGYFEIQRAAEQKIESNHIKASERNLKEIRTDKTMSKNIEESDSDIDNKEIERFLQRKTNKEYDTEPQKLKKMSTPKKREEEKSKIGLNKEKLLQKMRKNE